VIAFSFLDVALLVIVSAQATLLAYIPHPKWKALVMVLPIPFTLASLAVGAPVNTTHVAALNLLLAYTHAVRLLHARAGVPIIPAIVLSAAGYCGAGALLRKVLPLTPAAFWIACGLSLIVAAAAQALFPRPEEPNHRSYLPPWLKFPIIAGVILILIVMKRFLQGFMTMFPMVGVVASYESRTSLGLVCRAMPDFMLAMIPMMAVVRLVQPHMGLGPALGVGWLVFIPMLALLIRDFGTAKRPGPKSS
jgi:hypothetical protein